MLRLLHAGIIAASHQLIAVTLVAAIISLLIENGIIMPPASSAKTAVASESWIFIEPYLAWTNLLTAVGVIATSDGYLETSAWRIRLASRLMCPSDPKQPVSILLVHLWLMTIGLGVFLLKSPPYILVEAGYYLESLRVAFPAACGVTDGG